MTPEAVPGGSDEDPSARCPVCGIGVVRDVSFDVTDDPNDVQQRSDSHQLVTYSCGHEVLGGSLASADAEGLAVERRDAEDTVMPIDDEGSDAR